MSLTCAHSLVHILTVLTADLSGFDRERGVYGYEWQQAVLESGFSRIFTQATEMLIKYFTCKSFTNTYT